MDDWGIGTSTLTISHEGQDTTYKTMIPLFDSFSSHSSPFCFSLLSTDSTSTHIILNTHDDQQTSMAFADQRAPRKQTQGHRAS
jgi:hypothetical protein